MNKLEQELINTKNQLNSLKCIIECFKIRKQNTDIYNYLFDLGVAYHNNQSLTKQDILSIAMSVWFTKVDDAAIFEFIMKYTKV